VHMSQHKKLEEVLNLLISEDIEAAEELLHQIIIEKSRNIYEELVDDEMDDEEADDEVGGDEQDSFTDDISSDEDDIESDELSDGEAEDGDLDMDADDEVEHEDRIEDLEDQLAQLRAEFDALLSDEVNEPEHDDLDMDSMDMDGDIDMLDDSMYESRSKRAEPDEKHEKFTKAKKMDAKDSKHKKAKVDEETQFTTKVADTGQKSNAPGFAGTGKHTPKGAEFDKSAFTNAPSKPSYGGKPAPIGKGVGGEPGKYNGEHAADDTMSDNVDEKTKGVSAPSNTDKWSGTGKESGNFGTQQKKSPLSKAPNKSK
jgi:hypothetical protein